MPFIAVRRARARDAAGSRPLDREPRRPARPAAGQHRRRPARRHGHRQPLVRLRLHARPSTSRSCCRRSTATVHEQSAEAGTLGIVVPAGTAICWTYEVTNVSQNPTQTVNAGARDHVADRRQRHAGEPGRRLPPGLRRRATRTATACSTSARCGSSRRRASPGATSTAPDGTVANTVTVQARCVTTGVPGCVSGTTVADTAVNRVTGSGDRMIRIKKAINAVDPLHPTPAEEADSPTGPVLAVGSAITWTYRVTTTSSDAADDHADHRRQRHAEQRGRRLHAGLRERRREPERQARSGRGLALPARRGIGGARPVHEHRRRPGRDADEQPRVASSDTASYLGTTGIRIKKAVNAVDPLHPTARRGRERRARADVSRSARRSTYTYLVFGDSALPLTSVVVRRRQRHPGNSGRRLQRDLRQRRRRTRNGKLDFGEVWLFTSAGATATPLKLGVGTFTDTATVTATNGSPVSAQRRRVRDRQAGRASRSSRRSTPFDPAHPTYFEDANTRAGPVPDARLDRHLHLRRLDRRRLVPVSNVVVTDSPAMAIAPVTKANGKNIGDTNYERPARSGRDLDLQGDGHGRCTACTPTSARSPAPTRSRTPTLTKTDPANYTGAITPADHDRQGDQRRRPGEPDDYEDANDPTHPYLLQAGSQVVWTYMVTNPAGSDLTNVKVDRRQRHARTTRATTSSLTMPTSGDTRHERRARQERDVGLHGAGAHGGRRARTRTSRPCRAPRAATTYFDNDPASYFGWVVRLNVVRRRRTRSRPGQPDARSRTATRRPARSSRSARRSSGPTRSPTPATSRSPVIVTRRLRHGVERRPTTSRPKLRASGDTNGNGLIDPGEVWLFTSAGVRSYAVKAGQYMNVATASDHRARRHARHRHGPQQPLRRDRRADDHEGRQRRGSVNPTAYEDANFAPGVVLPRRLDRHAGRTSWTRTPAPAPSDRPHLRHRRRRRRRLDRVPAHVGQHDRRRVQRRRPQPQQHARPGRGLALPRHRHRRRPVQYMNTATANGVFRVGGTPFR